MESDLVTEWCHKQFYIGSISSIRTDEAVVGKNVPAGPPPEPPDWLPALQAAAWPKNQAGVDYRPHLYQEHSKDYFLCDSGSQVSAYPPEPGDKPIPNRFLKAANGTLIKCYGSKEMVIKLGRKEIKFNIIKADIESPILGWDFFRSKKLDLN